MSAEVDIPSHRLYGISFRPYTRREIQNLSVKEITNPVSFNMLQNATFGGLYDLALGSGAQERSDVCSTCHQPPHSCTGHLGHISLPLPVFNPVTFKTMYTLLRWMCFDCDHLLAPKAASYLFSCQMSALNKGLLLTSHELDHIFRNFVADTSSEQHVDNNSFEILKQRLDDCLEAGCKAARETFLENETEIRNIVGCRTEVYKEFVVRQKTSRGLCSNCCKPLRTIRHESMGKIFFGAKLKARQISNLRKKLWKQKYGTLPAEDDIEQEEEQTIKQVTGDQKPEFLQTVLTPAAAREHLRHLWKNSREVVQWIIGAFHSGVMNENEEFPTDVFFIDELVVPPSKYRPPAKMKGRMHDGPQTINLACVIKEASALKELLAKQITKTDEVTTQLTDESTKKLERIHEQWITLQNWVNTTIDSSLGKMLKDPRPGVKQILERKDGMFRKFMMGKRVNYAARSVISPDPCIATNEVGVPEIFAKRLTYSEPVTPWNIHEMRQAVINGPNFHPGALFIEEADGSKIMLSSKDALQRESLAKQLLTPSISAINLDRNKKVHRHIRTGDIVIMNRQPTLHRPSMQAHKVRVLKTEKTLRMNYSNCKAYNADFDGDEMNLHFPQSELARAESYNLASADHQYLVPKDGTPLAGLIQDHIVAGVLLLLRGQFFNRSQYQQLVFSSLTDSKTEIKQLPPAIIRPRRLWSGKQVFSTLLLNLIPEGKPPLSLNGEAKVKEKSWQNFPLAGWLDKKYRDGIENVNWRAEAAAREGLNLNSLEAMDARQLKAVFERMSESEVVIQHGELLVGVLDKNHYGPTPFGLVHCCYELYGGEMAGRLLTCLERLFTGFLQFHGFTLGILDILVNRKGNKKRRHLMKKCRHSGKAVAAKTFNLEARTGEEENDLTELIRQAQFSRDRSDMQQFDAAMKSNNDQFQNEISKACMPTGLIRQFPLNGLQLMVISGAKGSMVNCMQISCLLGQIELEGQRPPLMLSGRSLPTFVPYDVSPRAGGFVDGRFLTGIAAPEYFFHCMAGREGLVDTAVKTSRSGYLQRCLIKHMEGLTVKYDGTVRDSDGSVMQFHYGEDGLDILKTCFLTKHQFPFLISNNTAVMTKDLLTEVKSKMDTQKCKQFQEKMKQWKENNNRDPSVRYSPFLEYSNGRWSKFIDERNADGSEYVDHESFKKKTIRRYQKKVAEDSERYSIKANQYPDPVISVLRPDRYFGCVSENFQRLIDEYANSNPHNLLCQSRKSKKAREIGRLFPTDKFQDLLHLKYLNSLVHPGEAVGLLAAQSIGEPSTQMTLNTFHFAGRGDMNVTLGIPRLREILMTASANIKTPTMDVPLKNSERETLEKGNHLRHRLTRVYLSQVIGSIAVKNKWSLKKSGPRCRCYIVRINFLPHSQYCNDLSVTPQKILLAVENKFLYSLSNSIERAAKESRGSTVTTARISNRLSHTGEDISAPINVPDDADDVVDDDMNDDDTQAVKMRGKQQQERDYEGEEEEKLEIGEISDDDDNEMDGEVGGPGGNNDDNEAQRESEDGDHSSIEPDDTVSLGDSVDAEDDDDLYRHKSKKRKKQMDEARINRLLNSITAMCAYKYDADNELWCEATFSCRHTSKEIDITSLVEKEVSKAIISQVPGISRCVMVEEKGANKKPTLLRMEGVNIFELYKYDKILELNEFYTNDIHAMAEHYGIEAARSVIIKEIRDVFAAYGIGVDYRHLSLIADYMTFEGRYKAFNRMGLESHSSPFQKMSFETTMMFLRNAIVEGAKDTLNSPSARIVTGRVIGEGTGCFDLVVPIS